MPKKFEIEHFSSGHTEKGPGYKYFVPEPINMQWTWQDPELNTLLEKASIKLGELNSYARLVPDIRMFISLHVTKEAVVSSRIEGTQTNMEEALLPEDAIISEKRNDWHEVRNYMQALNEAIASLERLPVSSRLLRQAHHILLQGVRGAHKIPGEYRTSQNWIGGATLNNAVFIPPAHHYISQLMGDLENFLHNTDIHVPSLIRIGMAHYQFETIHPFLDGNGRIGRLLITLYMVSEKILEQPLLYLSTFFEKKKSLYYNNLTRVRDSNDMLGWLKYFLAGIEETAMQAVATLSEILKLKQTLEHTIRANLGRRSVSGHILLQHLFGDPVVNVKQVEKICAISTKAANELVAAFEENGILRKTGKQLRYRTYIFQPYLALFNQENIE